MGGWTATSRPRHKAMQTQIRRHFGNKTIPKSNILQRFSALPPGHPLEARLTLRFTDDRERQEGFPLKVIGIHELSLQQR